MAKQSAGVLPYRIRDGVLEVLICHPGGPLWARRDAGSWSIVKGEYAADEVPWVAAQREFREEVGLDPPEGTIVPLAPVRQRAGKVVSAFAVEGDLDITDAVSNEFEMEWPPRSGQMKSFPEIDRVEWCSVAVARTRLIAAQVAFLDELVNAVEAADRTDRPPVPE
ncbi:NUDIX domain-containing protein [Rhodococcus tibetensis]|uniref:NUDIX domain-containing protein n=1 Tax=Rhodococcus tibetensis TaxID=2965064 RepID=A0ABT1QK91_9NOCA|nr:NUDIX domain-containing protein [Rhodococcus sp. FXJ9.536]MCQ4122701.1 NUDIX domain-containing protein [Rhodococcus sp. FXJ9.536]